jgi:hypothetical protein
LRFVLVPHEIGECRNLVRRVAAFSPKAKAMVYSLQKRGVKDISDFPAKARRRKPPDLACPTLHSQSSPARRASLLVNPHNLLWGLFFLTVDSLPGVPICRDEASSIPI